MKHLLSVATAIFFSTSLMAQEEEIAAGQNQLWWANYDVDASTIYLDGTGITEHYDAAVFIPQGLVAKGDATINGFSFLPVTAAADNVVVWVAKTLTYDSSEWLEAKSVDKQNFTLNKLYDVEFDNHHAIPEEGLYVGVSFDIKDFSDIKAPSPLSFTNTDKNRKNSFFYRTPSKRTWQTIDGNAYVRVLVGSESFEKNAVAVNDFSTTYAVIGETASVPVKLRNMGTNDVETITYTITTDSVTSDEITKAINIRGYMKELTTTIDFPADDQTKEFSKRLTITKVNGKANECEKNVAEGKLITVAEHYQAVPVVEAFMSTEYGTSPAAIVGQEKSAEIFGDQFVFIATHCQDVMATKDYDPIINNVSTIPTSFLNRQYVVYPSAFFLKNSIQRELNRIVPAKLSLKAEWNGASVTATDITLDATATFCYDDSNADYGIAYVLLADSLKGSGTAWEQANNYSGESGYGEDMNFWYSAPEKVSGRIYNNVAIAAKDIFEGAKILDDGTISNGQTVSHSTKMSIAGNKLVQDKKNITAVALLIDRSNNQIVNAAKVAIADSGVGIEETMANAIDANTVGNYDLSGRKLNKVQKGLNIIRMANGKSKKVIY